MVLFWNTKYCCYIVQQCTPFSFWTPISTLACLFIRFIALIFYNSLNLTLKSSVFWFIISLVRSFFFLLKCLTFADRNFSHYGRMFETAQIHCTEMLCLSVSLYSSLKQEEDAGPALRTLSHVTLPGCHGQPSLHCSLHFLWLNLNRGLCISLSLYRGDERCVSVSSLSSSCGG